MFIISFVNTYIYRYYHNSDIFYIYLFVCLILFLIIYYINVVVDTAVDWLLNHDADELDDLYDDDDVIPELIETLPSDYLHNSHNDINGVD